MFLTPPIMLITDAVQAVLPLLDIITQSLDAGCKCIVLRDINASDDALLQQARAIRRLCVVNNAMFIVSRNAGVAKQAKADGLHLSSTQSIQEARALYGTRTVGKSCHTLQDVLRAQDAGADYVTLSPVFETHSKPGYGPAIGTGMLETICKKATVPVIALGGIESNNAKACLGAGAAGVAIMGHMMRSQTPRMSMHALITIL